MSLFKIFINPIFIGQSSEKFEKTDVRDKINSRLLVLNFINCFIFGVHGLLKLRKLIPSNKGWKGSYMHSLFEPAYSPYIFVRVTFDRSFLQYHLFLFVDFVMYWIFVSLKTNLDLIKIFLFFVLKNVLFKALETFSKDFREQTNSAFKKNIERIHGCGSDEQLLWLAFQPSSNGW